MKLWENLGKWQQRGVALVFFGGLFWGLFGSLNTPFHMDAEAAELWAASQRELDCKDALNLDERILAAEIRLATEDLSDEARALIEAQIKAWRLKREAIRQEHGC